MALVNDNYFETNENNPNLFNLKNNELKGNNENEEKQNKISLDGSNIEDDDDFSLKMKQRGKIKIAVIDSDSEDKSEDKQQEVDIYDVEKNLTKQEVAVKSTNRIYNLFNIDSHEEIEKKNEENLVKYSEGVKQNEKDAQHNEIRAKLDEKKLQQNEENSQENEKQEVNCSNVSNILSSLCDPESSDEESSKTDNKEFEQLPKIKKSNEDEFQREITNKEKSLRNKKRQEKHLRDKEIKSRNEEKISKKMTGKEAMEQRKEIRSESQRMLRETQVSLPYHKPKIHSIQEFFQKRPKFSTALPPLNSIKPAAIAIKMSTEELKLISKNLEEREKLVVEEFYKSESESEPEANEDSFENLKNNVEGENCKSNFDNFKLNVGLESGDSMLIEENLNTKCTEETLYSEKENSLIDMNSKSNKIEQLDEKFIEVDRDKLNFLLENVTAENITEEFCVDSCEKVGKKNLREKDAHERKLLEVGIIAKIEEKEIRINEEKVNRVKEDKVSSQKQENTENVKKNGLEELEISKDKIELLNFQFPLDEEFTVIADKEKNESLITESSPETLGENNFKTSNENLKKDEEKQSGGRFSKSIDEEKLEALLTKYNFPSISREAIKEQVNKEANGEAKEIKEEFEKKQILTPLQLLKEKLSKSQPKLSGFPGQVIDLQEGITKPNAITKLMERFIQHTAHKNSGKNKIQTNIVSVSGHGEIQKETVAMSIEPDEKVLKAEDKPGAKLQQLRTELQDRIAQKRSQLWQQKRDSELMYEEEKFCESEKSECGREDILDNEEEEEELTDDGSSSEEHLMENDILLRDNPKVKSVFLEDEAEEDCDEEGRNCVLGEDEEEIYAEENKDEDILWVEFESNRHEDCEKIVGTKKTKKKLKRIFKAFEDSDEENYQSDVKSVENIKILDSTVSLDDDDDDIPPPHQPPTNKTPQRQLTQTKSDLGFLTPICHLTGLQSLTSLSKFLQESPVTSPYNLSSEPSPLYEREIEKNVKQIRLQKQLFIDDREMSNDKDFDFYMEEISPKPSSHEGPTTQDLLEICSGNFSGYTQKEGKLETGNSVDRCGGIMADKKKYLAEKSNVEQIISAREKKENAEEERSNVEEKKNNIKEEKINTKDIHGITEAKGNVGKEKRILKNEDSNVEEMKINCLSSDRFKNIRIEEEDSKLISQLIDEEEIEKFKKKFDSPLKKLNSSGFIYESLSEEEDENRIKLIKKKRRRKAVVVDSEGEDEKNELKDITSDVNPEDNLNSEYISDVNSEDTLDTNQKNYPSDDNLSEDDLDQEHINLHNEVDYDSEENEVEKPSLIKIKPTDFIEKEAELSESEWESEDEDERCLDELEFEKCDTEIFDEEKMRRDLEKIHMRRVLDEDNKEIKILQEMLLEDGELHGSGRRRHFRWKNIDLQENEPEEEKKEEEVFFDEDESEEHWRKMRYEREIFLRKKQGESHDLEEENVSLDGFSQVIKLGQKVIIKNKDGTNSVEEKNLGESPKIKHPFSLFHKRGSFLARSDKVLQRLAEFTTKITESKVEGGVVKTSRNFLFQSVSNVSAGVSTLDKKRKASEGTPNVIKKLRLNNFSPSLRKNGKGKKLF